MAHLQGWTPYRAAWHQGRFIVDWCHLDSQRLVEPFFADSIVRAMAHPFNQVFRQRTPADALAALPEGMLPSGFIFHLSRCGSTLCSQALAALPEHIVVSEAQALNHALRAQVYGPATPEQRGAWFTGLINAFGQRRFDEQRRLFIKFLPMDIVDLPMISQLYPRVPWIFIYRDPLEIMVSQARQTSAEFHRGYPQAAVFGFANDIAAGAEEAEYVAHCLAAIANMALKHHRPGFSRLINHSQLPGALAAELSRAFGLEWSDADQQRVRAVSGKHAKHPRHTYADDRAEKQAEASEELRTLAQSIVGPAYAALELARAAKPTD